MLLKFIKGTKIDVELETEYSKLKEHISNILNQMNLLLEEPMGMMSDRLAGTDAPPREMGSTNRMPPPPGKVAPGDDLDEILNGMEQVIKQMDAAKRGLGLVNKLGDGASRTKHRSRVMGNMNRIRANVRRIEKMLANTE